MVEQDNGAAPAPPWRIGVDVGGTFTDMVLRDAAGALGVFKVPSVPDDPSAGVLQVLEAAAAGLGLDLDALLRDCRLFVHGSTIATNTILEKSGARVGLLTTHGFRDSLEVRRGIREDQWDHRAPFPEVLVPRYLRLPVRGRLDSAGRELEPLAEQDVAAAADAFAAQGVESVAVCLLNSYRAADHEDQAEAVLRRAWQGDWVSLSSRIAPVMGEYERASTAVVNAYIAPRVMGYLQALEARLRALGLERSMLLVQSNGGAVSVDQLATRPVHLVLSGPAAGVGALNLYRESAGSDALISMEIGGTSCDVMLMSAGSVPVSEELNIDGYHLATPSIEIHTVGAGGGTVAWVDPAGLLRVGPHGAGAVPGPASYGRGGTEPTVTDAQLLLGRLHPGPYAGGSVVLDAGPAHAAMAQKVAGPLGIPAEDAAAGVIRLLEQNLLHAVERISIQRGHDPRRFTLVAAGGAGPMHGASIARQLGCRRVYVPRQAGAFCALGMLHTDVRQDRLQVFVDTLDTADDGALEAGFRDLEAGAAASLAAEGFAGASAGLERSLDLRYRGQLWSIRVSAPGPGLDRAAVRAAFEAEHERQFGHSQPDGTIEITALRVTGWGRLEGTAPQPRAAAAGVAEPVAARPVYLDATAGWRDTPVYRGSDLRPGHELAGPALVEEATTTVFAGAGDRVAVDAADNLVITIGATERDHGQP